MTSLPELGGYFTRLMLGISGGLSGFTGISLPNISRGLAPESLFPSINASAPMSGQVSVMLGNLSGQLLASIPMTYY